MKTSTGSFWGWLSLAAVIFLNVSLTAPAATHYVDLNCTNATPPYTDWSTAATNIQDAVDAAVAGDQVLVTNGVYQTGASANNGSNRVNVAKALRLQSVNGPAVTVIKGYTVPGTFTGPSSVRCVMLTSGATLSGFTLTNGSASGNGGGVYCASTAAVVSNCIVTHNYAGSNGGGTYYGTHINCILSGNTCFYVGGGNIGGVFTNCILTGNSTASEGGGTYYAQTLVNCTVTDNHANSDGGGVYSGVLKNCIVYYNTSGFGNNIYNVSSSSVSNCCTPDFFNSSCISNAPALVDRANANYRLQPWSPCVNAGNNAFVTTATDLDGNARIVGGAVDIGAYEFQSPVHYVSLNSTNATPPYISWATAATNIQDAIDASTNGDLVLVTNGVYARGGRPVGSSTQTNRVLVTKLLTIQSINGPAATVIQGYQVPGVTNGPGAVRCLWLTNGAVLSGFTLTNGATLGAASTDPKVEQNGGGAYCYNMGAVLTNCIVSGCSAYVWGGGVIYGTFNKGELYGNSANSGGGTYLVNLNNCLVFSNTASASGGGVVRGKLNNCTLVANTAGTGGGVDGSSDGVLNNCVIYNNSASVNPNYTGIYTFHFALNDCCTVPLATNGVGNFTNAPLFVNLTGGDYHLSPASPCINAGNNSYVTNTTDLDGNPRIVGGTVDIGAYEYQTPSSVLSYAWAQQYGLPTDGTADYADTDGTGMNNWQKWIAGLNPTNPASVLVMQTPVATNTTAGVTVSWQSVNTRTYYLQRASDLITQPPFTSIISNLVGQAGTTSYTDTTATNAGPYFYRVGVQ